MFGLPVVDVSAASDYDLAGLLRDCARWRAQLDAFEAGVLAEFDGRHVAAADGCADTAAWLGRHAQTGAGAARLRVERANALAGLPGASAAFTAGSLGSDHAAVLARAVREVGVETVAADETRLLGWVTGTTPEQFARRVRRWVNTIRVDAGVSPTEAKRAERSASLRADLVTGTGRVHAELPADEYAVVANALWALVEEQWRAEHGADAVLPDRVEVTSRQRLADALVEMARRAMGASAADGHRARPTVIVIADADTLVGRLGAVGRCELADGTPSPPKRHGASRVKPNCCPSCSTVPANPSMSDGHGAWRPAPNAPRCSPDPPPVNGRDAKPTPRGAKPTTSTPGRRADPPTSPCSPGSATTTTT